MKKDLKITDAEVDKNLMKIFSNAIVKDTDDTFVNDDDIISLEDNCCKDADDPEENKEDLEETSDNNQAPIYGIIIDNNNYDIDKIKEFLADQTDCKLVNVNEDDDTLELQGTKDGLTELLTGDLFGIEPDELDNIFIEAKVIDSDNDEPDATEDKPDDAEDKEDKTEASAADSVFTEEEINMLKQLAAMAPDIIAAAEKANKEEEAEEAEEEPDDGSLTAGEEDEEDEDEEDKSDVTEMITEFGDSEDVETEDCDTVTAHDSKAAFGSIERHTSTVTDSIDEDLDLIALWNKRYSC